MLGQGLPVLFTVLLWWFSTGLVLLVCSLPRRTFAWTLPAGSLIGLFSLYGLAVTAREMTPVAAYVSFLCAIGVWGWLEMAFLMGYVTGPRTTPCPDDARGLQRFGFALTSLLYREFAVIVAGLLVSLMTRGMPNQTGSSTFLILLVMRISAELNIFLGVRHLPDSMVPDRLSHLKSYFRTRRFNLLFPISILGASFAASSLARRAFEAEGAQAVGCMLLAVLLALAILEHFFMMMPSPDKVLWSWAKSATNAKPIGNPQR